MAENRPTMGCRSVRNAVETIHNREELRSRTDKLKRFKEKLLKSRLKTTKSQEQRKIRNERMKKFLERKEEKNAQNELRSRLPTVWQKSEKITNIITKNHSQNNCFTRL